MPTPDDIRVYRQWRGRFISALWDAEAKNVTEWPAIDVPEIKKTIGADQLPEHTIARLVNDLVADGLIEPFAQPAEAVYPRQVSLSSYGRLEVERWIADDTATEHLALPPSQVFNTHLHGPVTGSTFVVASTGTTVNLQTAVGESMSVLVAKAKQLLSLWDGTDEEREEVTADVELVEQESADPSAPPGHMKTALRRIGAWAGSAGAAGASVALSEEVHKLAGEVFNQL